jgi:hypothetical protein
VEAVLLLFPLLFSDSQLSAVDFRFLETPHNFHLKEERARIQNGDGEGMSEAKFLVPDWGIQLTDRVIVPAC